MDTRTAIETGDVAALQRLLTEEPDSANSLITWGSKCELRTHPLHFVCDKVFDGTISGESAARLARALIEAGSDIDHENGDPMNAAASLGATEVGLLLLEHGARTDLRGFFGETALHWAATVGDDVLVQRLLEKGAPVDVRDEKWNATPIGWALHGWDTPPPGNQGRHSEVVVQLVRAGAFVDPEWVEAAQKRGREDIVSALGNVTHTATEVSLPPPQETSAIE